MNRISIGVQSFSEPKLKRLGRIHDAGEAKRAANLASGLGLRSFNLDLMHGLLANKAVGFDGAGVGFHGDFSVIRQLQA